LEDGQLIKLEKGKNKDGDTNMYLASMFTLVLSRITKEMDTELSNFYRDKMIPSIKEIGAMVSNKVLESN
jgi:hypothetical protein